MAEGSSARLFWVAAAALAVRVVLYPLENLDTEIFVLPWFEYLRAWGAAGLGTHFTNYTPFYTYLLLGAASADGLLPSLFLAKLLTLPFEFLAAFAAAGIARIGAGPERADVAARVAFVGVLFAPTVVLNGAAWGQCDIIYASALLVCVHELLRGHPASAIIAFGFALAVKAQAVFLLPFLLLLVLKRQLSPLLFLLVPLFYMALALPAALQGRPWSDLLTVYAAQGDFYRALSMNAANPWLFVGDVHYPAAVLIGLAVASLAGLAFAAVGARVVPLRPVPLIMAATLSLHLMPFLLPKMHDRYFFATELLSIPLAAATPYLAPICLLLLTAGTLAYGPFLLGLQGLAWEWFMAIALAANGMAHGLLWSALLTRRPHPHHGPLSSGSEARPGSLERSIV